MFELPVIGRFITVGDAAVAKFVLHNYPQKSPTYKTIFPLIGTKSLVTMQGEEWSTQRRIYNPGFSPDFLKGIVATIVTKCDRMLTQCDIDIHNGVATNMLAKAVDLTIDVIVSVGFGEDWYDGSTEGKRKVETVRDLTLLVGVAMKSPLKRYFNIPHMWHTYRLSCALDRDMKELVQKHTTTDIIPSEQKDILSLTLLRVLQSNDKKMTNNSKKNKKNDISSTINFNHEDMENVTSQLKTFYFAGHDTTATTIAWAYWLLVQHPDELDRARLEVATHVGPFSRDYTYDKLQKCEFLDAVARETLRLYPPAASTRYVSSSSPSSTSDPSPPNAGGYLLQDSVVHINFYAIQRDPDYWYEPNKFIPSRFLGDKGKERITSSFFLPFSKGTRDCIGKYFALLEIKIALAALITKYDGCVVTTDEEYVARLTSIPKNGCMVNLSRRK
jgi:cytochrome P450